MTRNFFILGATASGKSALALELARVSGGVVCNMDAFQVYRGLDIGTGKPTVMERDQVPHALFDLVGPCDPFTVADYLRAAEAVIAEAGGRPLIWVGGTGLYCRMLRFGLAPAPPSDPNVVRELEAMDAEARVEEIRRVDPAWAAAADLANPRRVIRALAVFRQTGRALSDWHGQPTQALVPEGELLVLRVAPERLRSRIVSRVAAMWAAGWPEEVRQLAELPGWEGSSSFRALGYVEVLDWLRRGGDAGAVQERIAQRTWQYARRQLTWLRREPKLEIVEIDERFDPQRAARALLPKIMGRFPSPP
jgi:tRNA dimethylallyltransferase